MGLSTILIGLCLAALYYLAIRYVAKNGACSGCSNKESCHSDSAVCGNSCPAYRLCKTKAVIRE